MCEILWSLSPPPTQDAAALSSLPYVGVLLTLSFGVFSLSGLTRRRAKGRGPSKRGVGLSFGPDVTEKFCKLNGLSMVVRSHEVKEEGYEIDHNGQLVTVFSAPNCQRQCTPGAMHHTPPPYHVVSTTTLSLPSLASLLTRPSVAVTVFAQCVSQIVTAIAPPWTSLAVGCKLQSCLFG